MKRGVEKQGGFLTQRKMRKKKLLTGPPPVEKRD